MENKFLKIENEKEWRDLLGKVFFKTFFHSWEWESFLEKTFPWLKFERYVWPAQNGQAILSLARVKINGKEKLVSHPFCEYGGPLPLVDKIDGEKFKQELLEEFKIPLKISFHPALLHYFGNLGIVNEETPRETYLINSLNLQNQEQLWEKIDRNRHRSIKTAQEYGFRIEKCQNLKDLKILYTFYVKNLKRHKTLVYPFSFFEFFFKNAKAEILLVKKDKKIVGGNIFLFYDRIVHSFLCGFDEKCKKFGLHSLMLWTAIKQGRERGMEAFDLGAVRKTSPLEDFKQRWGAEAFPILELKNYASESKLKDSFLRDVWSYLPSPLVKVLSSYFIKYKL